MSTKAIEQFLQTAYSDEKLAALLAHAEDGKLSYNSCCCLIGIPSADHALRGRYDDFDWHPNAPDKDRVENAFLNLCGAKDRPVDEADALRRARLIPMIRAEIARRDALRTQDGRDARDSVRSQELAGVLTR